MRVSFRDADFSALSSLWIDVAPKEFPLSPARMKTHWLGSPLFDWGASAIEIEDGQPVAFLAVKRSAASLYKGPDPDMAHIAAFACRECQQGVDLLAQAKRLLIDRGVYRLAFGQDSLHMFPGCPDNWHKLHDFLTVEGFANRAPCFDLVQDLASFNPRCEVASEVRPCTYDDIPALREFLEREFPGRWTYDTMQKLEIEGSFGFVYGLFFDGNCEGFAMTQDESHRLPMGGAVFLSAIGPDACALGPIGVSMRFRDQGWGDRLLASTLAHLKESGKRRCRIDWTTLSDWYGKHGFEVERTYQPMVLDLEELIDL